MAFDAFRSQVQARRVSPRRRLIYAGSVLVHAGLIAIGVLYSFWHIEELSPPLLKVTFLSAAPPPPPPPPPAGGGGAARKPKVQVKPKPVVQPKPADIVQPREQPKKEPPPEDKPKPDDGEKGEKGGVKGGVEGGTVGGTLGGTIGGKQGGVLGGTPGGTGSGPPPKFLPPNMGAGQKASGADPPFPTPLRKPGITYRVLAKICVASSGAVDKVTIMKGADVQLDEGVVSTVKTWRYRPLMANATAVPFCYPATFEFRSQ